MSDESLRSRGRAIRVGMQGEPYVLEQRSKDDAVWQVFQDAVDYLYGSTWGSSRLSLRERSLITVAALAVGNRPRELQLHLSGARRNGVTTDELKEVAFQLSLYAGLPIAVGLWRQIEALAEEQMEAAP